MSISPASMTIRWAFERRSGSKEGLSHLRIGMRGLWLPIALALGFVPSLLPGQIVPGTAGSQPTGPMTTSQAARSAFPPGGGASAPAGDVLGPNDYVGVEVFGEDDLRTSGRLNPEGNLSVPLLGSVHLAGLTLTQAASKLTEFMAAITWSTQESMSSFKVMQSGVFPFWDRWAGPAITRCPTAVPMVSISSKRSR